MKKLPKIYQNQIDKKFNNNTSVYYSSMNSIKKGPEQKEEQSSVRETLQSLVQEKGYIFNKPILIKTKDKILDTAIVYMNETNITTLNEDIIKIEDILSITRK